MSHIPITTGFTVPSDVPDAPDAPVLTSSADHSSITTSSTLDIPTSSTTSSIAQLSSDSTAAQTPTAAPSTSTSLKPGIIAAIAIPSFLLVTGIIIHLTLYFHRRHLKKKASVTNIDVVPYTPAARLHSTRKAEISTRIRDLDSGPSGSNTNMTEVVESRSEVSYSTLPPPYIPGLERGIASVVEGSSVEESGMTKEVHVGGVA